MQDVETAHFRVAAGMIRPRGPVDNTLADHIAAELVPLGLVPDSAAFERLFVEAVLATAVTPQAAWAGFYRRTLRRLRRLRRPDQGGADSVSTFARIYARVGTLIRGRSVLDVGSCFGFLPILLAERAPGLSVIGCDLVPSAAGLAARATRSRRNRTAFVAGDAHRLPVGNAMVDTVTCVHVLEHLPVESTTGVLAELCRAARHRVVVAVPLETVPDPTYGHVRTFDLTGLADLGRTSGWRWSVHESDGGWLVLDRPPATCPVG